MEQVGNDTAVSRRVALRLMYDGTAFLGWQRQRHGRTVQQELEKMLSRLCGNHPVAVVGAGRTDSGVHAHGQVAHADLRTRYNDAELLHALRRMSPLDLAVLDLATAPAGFHARFKACARSYCYTIINQPSPFLVRYAWYMDRTLDLELLNHAAGMVLGEHDFTGLSKHNPDTLNMICTIARSEWVRHDRGVEYHVTADRFLYGMVRLLVGIQIDIVRGRRSPGTIQAVIAARDRNLQSAAAPAVGLSLADVRYPSEFDPWR